MVNWVLRLGGLRRNLHVPQSRIVLTLQHRWLFFVEGILTIVVAVSAIWILPDFPSTPCAWLSPDEQVLAKQRMEEDIVTGDEHQDKFVELFSGITKALVDWRVWWLGTALCFMIGSLSFGNFFPTLSATMGYNATISLLLCAPPWILGTATSFFVARSVFIQLTP
jgi:hypothetical protein